MLADAGVSFNEQNMFCGQGLAVPQPIMDGCLASADQSGKGRLRTDLADRNRQRRFERGFYTHAVMTIGLPIVGQHGKCLCIGYRKSVSEKA